MGFKKRRRNWTASKHVLALEDILKGAKKPVRPMSIATWSITNDIAESDFLDR